VLRARDIDKSKLKLTDPSDAKETKSGELRRDLETKLMDPVPPSGPATSAGKTGSSGTTTRPGDGEAPRLSAELVKAPPDRQDSILATLRDNKGAANTEALALAIPQLTGSAKQKVRDALAERLARMSASTLRSKLRDEDAEIRRAAALACVIKEDSSLTGNVLGLLEDPQPSVRRAAYVALKTLTGQDFGSSAESIAKWKEWLTGRGAGTSNRAKAETPNNDKETLEGTWLLQSSESAGKPSTRSQLAALRLRFVFTGDNLRLESANGAQKARFELGADKNPKTMDIIIGKAISRGIYELDGETLKLCWVGDGDERPRDFSTSPRGKETLYIFKRQ